MDITNDTIKHIQQVAKPDEILPEYKKDGNEGLYFLLFFYVFFYIFVMLFIINFLKNNNNIIILVPIYLYIKVKTFITAIG